MKRTARRPLLRTGGIALLGCLAGCIGMGDEGDANITATDRQSSSDDQPEEDTRIDTDRGDDNGSDENSDEAPPHEEPPTSRRVDAFEELASWWIAGGTLSAEHDTVLSGSQAARIEVPEEEVRPSIRLSFDVPIDITGSRPQLGLRSEHGHLRPWIRCVDETGDYIDFRTFIPEALRFQMFDFGIADIEGKPDLTSIEEVRIEDFIGDERREILADELRASPVVDPGTIVIQFDDTLETDATRALPLLEAHDMTASTFINPGYLGREVGGRQRLDLRQLDALHNAGWDICNHGMTHANLAEVDEATKRAEITEAADWLVDHGFEDGARYFAYPFAAYDQSAIDIVADHHELAFDAGYPAVGRSANPYLIQRSAADPTFAEARDQIDLTAKYGGITTIYYHELTDERVRAFEKIVSYLDELRAQGTIDVKRVSEVGEDFVDQAMADQFS